MELIDKSAVVAELDRIEYETNYEPFTEEVLGKRKVCKDIKDLLDKLKISDMDSYEKKYKEVFLPKDYDTQNSSWSEEEKLKWKPNMAQINALYAAIKQIDKGNADVLKGLYKKLIQL